MAAAQLPDDKPLPTKWRRTTTAHPLTAFEKGAIMAFLFVAWASIRPEILTHAAIAHLVGCSARTITEVKTSAADDDNPKARSKYHDLHPYLIAIVLEKSDITPLAVVKVLAERHPDQRRLLPAKDLSAAAAVRRELANVDLLYEQATRRPPLGQAEKNQRFEFVRTFDLDTFDYTIFTDEMMIAREGSAWRWMTSNEMHFSSIRIAHSERYMVWGGVSTALGQLPLVVWPKGTMVDADKYIEDCLEGVLLPFLDELDDADRARVTIMQDGAGLHWTDKVEAWFATHNIRVLRPWPPHSPDLNQIELIWARVKSIVNGTFGSDIDIRTAARFAWAGACSDLNTLKARVLENWKRCAASGGGIQHRTA